MNRTNNMNWLASQFELARGGESANLKSMEGLRGLAVFLVFLVHYATLVRPWIPDHSGASRAADALQAIGHSGVDLFFVLSGYLIYGSLMTRRQPYASFIFRRIERIYPAFTVVFLLYLGLSFVFRGENKIPADATKAAIYLAQNFLLLPGLFPIEPMITVAWSLSYEMFYYLMIPVAIEVLRLRQRSPRFRVLFFVLVTLLLVAYGVVYNGHVRLIMFISGILLFEALKAGEAVPGPSSAIGLLALALGLSGMLLPIAGWTGAGAALKIGILFIAFFIVCLSCFKSPSGWLARSFGLLPLRWLGNMSYSYYLIHGLALKAAFLVLSVVLSRVVFGSWFFWALLPVMFVVTLIPAAALFLAVERPLSLSTSRKRHSTWRSLPSGA